MIRWRADKDRWQAAILLRDGRRASRYVWTRDEAEAAITDLRAEHADNLGYHYLGWPRHPELLSANPRKPRSGVTSRVRFAVLSRDGFKCRYCGAPAPEVRLTVDHVMPVSRGGSDDMDNLVAACEDCNAGKADL